MDKSMVKGVFLTLVILSFFGIVFAVGFHTANEITSGTFLGDYVFTGNLDFTNATILGNGSSSIVNGWPDAINCNDGSYRITLTNVFGDLGNGQVIYRYTPSPTSTNDFTITFASNGNYLSSSASMATYNCAASSMSIQDLYDSGDAFNLVGGFDNHKVNCPTGFTSLESKGKQLGCIQNSEEGQAVWKTASEDCWDTYGALLPTYEIIMLAFNNLALTDESDDHEFTSDVHWDESSTQYRAVYYNPTGQYPGMVNYETSTSYRCFIPN